MVRFLLALIAIIAASTPPAAFSADMANLDPTFAAGGILRIGSDSETLWASGSVLQSDGKIVIAGSSSDTSNAHTIVLVRLGQDGQIDEQFGDKGVAKTKIGANCYPRNISLMSDGRLIVGGWAYVSEERVGIALVMYSPSGALDRRFANQGVLIFPKDYLDSTIRALAVQRDGKILVSGETIGNRPPPYIRRLPRSFLARVNGDGTFDSAFGDNGVVALETPALTLGVQDDGKILTARVARSGRNVAIVIARYNAEGAADDAFGGNGSSVIPTTPTAVASGALFALETGKIVGLFGSRQDELTHRLITLRLNRDGSLDSDFGQAGMSITNTQFWHYTDIKSVASPDRTYWVVGQSLRPRGPGGLYYYDFGIAHLLSNGQLDASFGSGGMRVVSVGSETDASASVVVQRSERPVLIGQSANHHGRQIVAVRFLHQQDSR